MQSFLQLLQQSSSSGFGGLSIGIYTMGMGSLLFFVVQLILLYEWSGTSING